MLEALRELSQDPVGGPNIKRLHGAEQGRYRYRQGDYRILYELEMKPRKVRVLTIKQRGRAYKKR